MTYAELKEKWDHAMQARDRAINRGEANGIEGNLSLLNSDSSVLVAVVNQMLIKLAESEKEECTP